MPSNSEYTAPTSIYLSQNKYSVLLEKPTSNMLLQNLRFSFFINYLLKNFKSKPSEITSILDVGCGKGAFYSRLRMNDAQQD